MKALTQYQLSNIDSGSYIQNATDLPKTVKIVRNYSEK